MSNRNRHLYQYHSEAFESSRAENEQAVQSAAAVKAEMGKRHEIKSLRTANTKTFENQDHTITKSIYLEDIHYQDEDGSPDDIRNADFPFEEFGDLLSQEETQ